MVSLAIELISALTFPSTLAALLASDYPYPLVNSFAKEAASSSLSASGEDNLALAAA